MSEKELRKVLAQCGLRLQEEVNADGASILDENWTDKVALLEDICEAASEDPDVVAVLRWVTHQLEVAKRTGARIPRQEGMEWGYQGVIRAIEVQFHVRLTDEGWKRTDDGYQDPMDHLDRPDCMP